MALNVGLDESFRNMQGWKRMQDETREVNTTQAYVTNDETFVLNP
jgi:hypothetical protein